MRNPTRSAAGIVAGIILFLAAGSFAQTRSHPAAPPPSSKEVAMTKHATGGFEVKLSLQAPDDKADNGAVGRLTIDKRFHGDLEATSKGQMLAHTTAVQGSAGYVAMEQVTGTLHGRAGTFVLQHTGTMARGVPQLSVTVVPDSGTGQLAGLAGRMEIKIDGGKHSYDFEYTLAAAP